MIKLSLLTILTLMLGGCVEDMYQVSSDTYEIPTTTQTTYYSAPSSPPIVYSQPSYTSYNTYHTRPRNDYRPTTSSVTKKSSYTTSSYKPTTTYSPPTYVAPKKVTFASGRRDEVRPIYMTNEERKFKKNEAYQNRQIVKRNERDARLGNLGKDKYNYAGPSVSSANIDRPSTGSSAAFAQKVNSYPNSGSAYQSGAPLKSILKKSDQPKKQVRFADS